MKIVEDDHLIQTLAGNRANHAFHLPWGFMSMIMMLATGVVVDRYSYPRPYSSPPALRR